MSHWNPARLPDGFHFEKARVVGDSVVVLGSSIAAPARLFVRPRLDQAPVPVAAEPDEEVRDFEHLPTAGGVFVLSASRIASSHAPTGFAWTRFRLSRLLLETRALERVFSNDDWQAEGGPSPAALLGCSPDGARIAVAFAERIGSVESGSVQYRLGFVDPIRGEVSLAEPLVGLFF